MSEEITPVVNPMEMVVTTNSAPVEQRSTEMVTTEPKTPAIELEDSAPVETHPEPEVIEAKAPEDTSNDVARKALDAEIRAQNAERQLKELQPKPKELGDRPKIENFDTLENYDKAVDEWNEARAGVKFQQDQVAKQRDAEAAKIRTEVQLKAKESRTKHADFDQVVAPLAPVMDSIPILSDFIARNPMGTEVAYELAKQPALLEQLRNQDMWTAGEALISMAARLKAPKPVQLSNAPEPIKPVGSRETVKPKLTELAAKDINGYIAKMNKAELAKRRAN